MIFRNYNDFEVINLIKEGNEEAFNFMVDKYCYLIAKKIKIFNLTNDFDDCYQEALMVLHRSILKFDESFNKTFTRYFEKNLINFLISFKKKQIKYINFQVEKLPTLCAFLVNESERIYFSDKEINEAYKSLSDFEKKVFQSKVVNNMTIKECSDFLQCDDKKIHNAIDRIRKKIKLYLMI